MALQDIGTLLKDPKTAQPVQDLGAQGNEAIRTIHSLLTQYLQPTNSNIARTAMPNPLNPDGGSTRIGLVK